MHLDRASGHRAPLLWLVLPFAVGIGVAHARTEPVSTAVLVTVALLGLGGALLGLRRRPRLALAAMALAVAAGGALHLERHRQRLPDWDRLPAREAQLVVRVDRPFQTRDLNERLSVIGTAIAADAHLQDLVGQSLHVRVWRYHNPAPVQRGGLITVRGELEPLPRHPPLDESDGFIAYLIDNGINFRLGRGRLVDATLPSSAYARWRGAWAERLDSRLGAGLEDHPALAGALSAMVLGQRRAIGDEAKALFMRSGTMHLFAISGLHIGVVAVGLYTMLRLLRLGPRATMIVGSTLLAFYVDLIGQPPSAVRAWLMVTCLQLGRISRAPQNPVSSIAGSALLVLLLDPLQLFSAGFQMSYGIVMALLLYGLPMAERWQQRFRLWRHTPECDVSSRQRWWRRRWEEVLTSVAMAWAATLVGLIAGVAFFGWFSPFALAANLVLIPLAFVVIKCGFIALLAAAIGLTPVVMLFNHAAALVLLVMQSLLATAMRLPGSAWPAGFVHPWWGPGAICALLVVMAWGYSQGWQGRWARPWWPAALAAVVLVSGMRMS